MPARAGVPGASPVHHVRASARATTSAAPGVGSRAASGVDDEQHRRGPLQDGGHLAGPHARVDPRRDGAQAEQRGVEHGVVDGRRQEQADDVALGHTAAGQVPGHAVGGPVPLGEGEGAAPASTVGLDVRLDVAVDPCRLPEDRHHGLVPIRGDAHWHGGRRWYQGCRNRPPAGRSYARDVLVALCGGVGAARMLSGLVRVVPADDITAIVNVGDDMVLHGLHISPDLDTVTYTLAGMDNRETGWGVAGESWAVMDELARLGGEDWFRLGDRDLATHLFRTGRLRAGAPLSAVTAELAGRRGIARAAAAGDRRRRCAPGSPWPRRARSGRPGPRSASRTTSSGSATTWRSAASASTAPSAARPGTRRHGVARRRGHHRGLPVEPRRLHRPRPGRPGRPRDAGRPRRTQVVAVSPIVAGAALKGPADRLMAELGTEPSVVGVARLYAPWVGTLVVDVADAALRGRGRGRGRALRRGAHRHEHARAGRGPGPDGGRCRRLRACTCSPSPASAR